jgi:hypothetical protein
MLFLMLTVTYAILVTVLQCDQSKHLGFHALLMWAT